MPPHPTVSFDDEPLILVDSQDHIIGYDSKIRAHHGTGILHRAFSIFLVTPAGEVLLQQRSAHKPLWPLFWSNSCCSHPRRGETNAAATARRLHEELALATPLQFLYQFQYHATYLDRGAEYELCSVYVGQLPTAQPIHVNPHEIAAWQWLPAAQVDELVATSTALVTPWFALEWARLRTDFNHLLQTETSAHHAAA